MPISGKSLTYDDLTEILARARAATPGPWICRDQFVETAQEPSQLIGVTMRQEEGLEVLPATKNAEFIAHARQDIPRLVAEILFLREQIQKSMNKNVGVVNRPLFDVSVPAE